MAKKKKKIMATMLEYEQHKNVHGLTPWSVQQIFGKDAVHGVARFVSINRDKIPEQKVEQLEFHGSLVGPIVQTVGSDTWEVLECEVIIIPRRRLIPAEGKRMRSMTAQQIYLGSDILNKMENSYLIREHHEEDGNYDPDEIEVIQK